MSIKSTRLKKRILALILMIALLCTSMDMEAFYIETKASDDVEMTTLYLVDNTNEKWIGNDNAIIELVDNTNGHKHYTMKKMMTQAGVWMFLIQHIILHLTD